MEKKSHSRGKRLNVLGEEHNKPILFRSDVVRQAQAIASEKEEYEKLERARIDGNKAIIALKKQAEANKKAEKALQVLARESNKDEIAVKEKAEQRVQKKKERVAKKATNIVSIRPKTPTQATNILESKLKVVRFDISVDTEGVVLASAKSTKLGRVIKPRIVLEQGRN